MSKIKVERGPSEDRLASLEVRSWPIWTKESSEFPWTYDAEETCYFLEGNVMVTTEDGEQVKMGAGDLVTFPRGMSCTWKVDLPVRKHYTFGD
ncbi:MAG: cupin domain-containing protein [Deltaproteobacteria bacterium]|nr:cupin domain-containing protein [Deltaproteobacteria bacterium]